MFRLTASVTFRIFILPVGFEHAMTQMKTIFDFFVNRAAVRPDNARLLWVVVFFALTRPVTSNSNLSYTLVGTGVLDGPQLRTAVTDRPGGRSLQRIEITER